MAKVGRTQSGQKHQNGIRNEKTTLVPVRDEEMHLPKHWAGGLLSTYQTVCSRNKDKGQQYRRLPLVIHE